MKNNTIFDNVNSNTNKDNKAVDSEDIITEWKKFLQTYNSCYFDIHNPYAVCCSDPSYYRVAFRDFLKLFNTNNMIENYCYPKRSTSYEYLKLLAKNPQDFEIVQSHDDGCHTSYQINRNVNRKAHAFDYKKIFNEYQKLIENMFLKAHKFKDDYEDRDRD